jgi:hypothetical protein
VEKTLSIQDLIAKARAEADNPPTDVAKVVVAGELVALEFTKLIGADWSALTAVHRPRTGAQLDQNLGYNLDAVAGEYPTAGIKINGEVPTGTEWADLYRLLDAPWRETVALKLWGLNQHGPATRILELGKASSGAGSRKKRN